MRNLIKRALVACVIVATAMTGAPSVAGDTDPLSLPMGSAPTLPWYDDGTQEFHFGETVLPSPATDVMLGVRLTDTGILIDDGKQRLVHLTASGETRVVLSRGGGGYIADWAVRTGTYAGRQVAASVGRSGVRYLEVRKISDGSLVRRTRLQNHVALHGFHSKRVWYGPSRWDPFVAHTFNVATGQRVFSVVRTPSEYNYVNVRLNALGVTLSSQGGVRFRPLTGNAFPAWSRADFRVMSVSPDRAFVLTAPTPFDEEFDSDPTQLQIRNARTGALVRKLPYYYWVEQSYAWEDNDTVILSARHHIDSDFEDYVTVRTDIDGTQERIIDGTHGGKLDGPDIEFPTRR